MGYIITHIHINFIKINNPDMKNNIRKKVGCIKNL